MSSEQTAQPGTIDLGPIVMSVPSDKIFAALAKAQAKLGKLTKSNEATIPGKDGKGGYSYSYADLGDTIGACMQHLASEGLAVIQAPVTTGRGVEVSTMLTHESGQWLLIKPLHMPTGNSPQALGSAITYARRYQLQPAVGLAAEDDDGAKAEATPPTRQDRRHRPDTRDDDGEALCRGKAAGIAAANDKLAEMIANRVSKKKGTVWRSACKALGIDPKPPADLTISDGNTVKSALRKKLDELEQPAEREPGDDPDEDDPTETSAP